MILSLVASNSKKKLTQKRFAKTISKSLISSSTFAITNLSKLIKQLERYIDNQRDFNNKITSKFRCISKIVFKIKTFENAKKINNAFKKIAKFCKKVIVIIKNQIVNVTIYFSKNFFTKFITKL